MRYFSKVLTTLVLFAAMAPAHAATGQFGQLRQRLLHGEPTTSIVDLSQCKTLGEPATRATGPIGGMLIQDFMIMPGSKGNIGYSDNHLTVNPKDGTPVMEIIQYQIWPDETGTVTVNRFSPKDYTQLGKPRVFTCWLGAGLRFEPSTYIHPATTETK